MRTYKKRNLTAITKYNPNCRDKFGSYLKDEWTSISDIGNIYDNDLFTFEEYLRIENLYVDAVFLVMDFFKTKSIKIEHIFKFAKIKEFKKYKSLDLYDVFLNLQPGAIIKDKVIISNLIKLRLREHIVELELLVDSKSGTELVFGFDYYIYIKTNKNISLLLKQINEIGLFTR